MMMVGGCRALPTIAPSAVQVCKARIRVFCCLLALRTDPAEVDMHIYYPRTAVLWKLGAMHACTGAFGLCFLDLRAVCLNTCIVLYTHTRHKPIVSRRPL
jgi:hypothetical protein